MANIVNLMKSMGLDPESIERQQRVIDSLHNSPNAKMFGQPPRFGTFDSSHLASQSISFGPKGFTCDAMEHAEQVVGVFAYLIYLYNIWRDSQSSFQCWCVTPPEGVPACDGENRVEFRSQIVSSDGEVVVDEARIVSYYPLPIPGDTKLECSPRTASRGGFLVFIPPGTDFSR